MTDWIETSSGLAVSLLNPKPEDIRIEDIAHSLAKQCRYNGHCSGFYSVAQHSVLVAEYIERTNCNTMARKCALLHDATEAYIGDVVSPVRNLPNIKPAFDELEDRFHRVIAKRFGLDWTDECRALVRHADRVICATEASQMLPSGGKDWGLGVEPLDMRIIPHSRPEMLFLTEFYEVFHVAP